MITAVFNLFYMRLRGRSVPSSVPPRVLVSFAARRLLMLLNGSLRASNISGTLALIFRSKNVTLRNTGFLSLGSGVALAEGVLIDGFSINGVSLAEKVTVGRGSAIMGSGVIGEPGVGVSIGPHTALGSNNVVWGQGGVTIGRDCLFGPNVSIVSEDHQYKDKIVPIRAQGYVRAAVSIGNDCWLGAGVVVTAGTQIGDGCVVGAGAVVTADLPSYCIAVGVPARVIGVRGQA